MAKSPNRYFCLIPEGQENIPANTGLSYVLKNRSSWIPSTVDIDSSLAPGWTKGADFIAYENKAYAIYKTFMFPKEDIMVYLCKYSAMGCDKVQ